MRPAGTSTSSPRVWRSDSSRAVDGWKRRTRRAISLVDQVSFVLMRRLHLDTAFAFDRDFDDEGFALYPP